MNYFKFFIAVLIALTFSLTANGGMDVDGGPRTVIQAKIAIIVEQPTPTNLNIEIVDSAGNTVIELETEELSTVISTEELDEGNYTVKTIDDDADYQVFDILIE